MGETRYRIRVEGQLALEEQLRRAPADLEQLTDGEPLHRMPPFGASQQVARDQALVGLAHLGQRLSGPDVPQPRKLEAAIGSAGAQDGHVQHHQ